MTWMYDYGARYMSPREGIFLGCDPLMEKYPGLSPFAYCVNNPIMFVDPDGMEPGDPFDTEEDAAIDFGNCYNDNSIKMKLELASTIYKYQVDGKNKFTYNTPFYKDEAGSNPNREIPEGAEQTAIAHTHGNFSKDYVSPYEDANNTFSGAYDLSVPSLSEVTSGDIGNANLEQTNAYVSTPSGRLLKYIPGSNKIDLVSLKIPSDNYPGRENNLDYRNYPKDEPMINFYDYLEKVIIPVIKFTAPDVVD